jgi:hypothetical protein
MAERLYLYLTRRDKTGMKLVSEFPAPKSVPPTRVTSIDGMNLPTQLADRIRRTIDQDRMLFEPWIESAVNFAELKGSLKRRGYRNLPNSAAPIHDVRSIVTDDAPPRTKHLPKRKTMLRRASRLA